MRFELDDLPPAWRAQAERQMAERENRKSARRGAEKRRGAPPALPCAPPGVLGPDAPESERRYYFGVILPRLTRGEIVRVLPRERFLLLPAREYGGLRLPAAHYTPDFLLELPSGKIEAVEVKSKFTRAAQRDYIYRRRLFIDLVAEPRGWMFTEYIADRAPENGQKSRSEN